MEIGKRSDFILGEVGIRSKSGLWPLRTVRTPDLAVRTGEDKVW